MWKEENSTASSFFSVVVTAVELGVANIIIEKLVSAQKVADNGSSQVRDRLVVSHGLAVPARAEM
ncbi:hypothetical protein [Glutamicibacter protophormiae]|uniref:hypothetical protein n=1 Tax=Glutamicibacter protophormiae TaxID=37930 RepID=UPI0033302DC2